MMTSWKQTLRILFNFVWSHLLRLMTSKLVNRRTDHYKATCLIFFIIIQHHLYNIFIIQWTGCNHVTHLSFADKSHVFGSSILVAIFDVRLFIILFSLISFLYFIDVGFCFAFFGVMGWRLLGTHHGKVSNVMPDCKEIFHLLAEKIPG